MKRMTLAVFAALLMIATSTSFAATSASPYPVGGLQTTLQIQATVQTAVELTLATGTGCAVNSPGASTDYTMNLGSVDALGINKITSTCGNAGGAGQYAPSNPGVTDDTTYYSNYTVTPLFTSFTNGTGTVSVTSTGFAANVPLHLLSGGTSSTVPANYAAFTAINGTASNVVASAASGTTYTRWIGVSVDHTNAGTVAGVGTQDNATVTFTLTIP